MGIKLRAYYEPLEKMFYKINIMHTIQGNPWFYGADNCSDIREATALEKDCTIFMLSTGWKDRNDKEGYDEDIVQFEVNGHLCYGKIVWSNLVYGFAIEASPTISVQFKKPMPLYNFLKMFPEAVIVGNVYENPKLLEEL
jgi:hypothetical protein